MKTGGKGRKDRYAMLSPRLLHLLREWWRIARPQGWLFPGQNPINPLSTRQLNRACHMAASLAEIGKRISPHTLRHSFATPEKITRPVRPTEHPPTLLASVGALRVTSYLFS